jgi:hypothetical protein
MCWSGASLRQQRACAFDEQWIRDVLRRVGASIRGAGGLAAGDCGDLVGRVARDAVRTIGNVRAPVCVAYRDGSRSHDQRTVGAGMVELRPDDRTGRARGGRSAVASGGSDRFGGVGRCDSRVRERTRADDGKWRDDCDARDHMRLVRGFGPDRRPGGISASVLGARGGACGWQLDCGHRVVDVRLGNEMRRTYSQNE